MYALRAAVLTGVAVVALSATGVRIGNHPAYVRVVVDFNGRVPANQVVFDHLWTRTAALHVERRGIGSWTSGGSGQGVRVALQPATQRLNIGMSFAPRRFKYVSYAVVGGNRLAIDLWKSAPPPELTGSHTCRELTIATDWAANGNTVWVDGHVHGIFENQFQVVVRGHDGAVLGRKTVHGHGKWKVHVHYHVAHRQSGTVEAVALSPKDGALECLAQEWLSLPAN